MIFFITEREGEVVEREEEDGEVCLGLEKLLQEWVPIKDTKAKERLGDQDSDFPNKRPDVPKITQRGRRVNKPSHLRKDYIC